MSKIEKELVKATGIEAERGESRQDFLVRLAKAVGKLADKAWDALSEEAQDWFNTNADARNKAKKADKELPDFTDFPDAEKEEEEKPRGRRRSDDDDEPAKSSKSTGGPDVLEEGMVCTVETLRGKTYEGKVIELGKKDVVIKTADDEVEISLDKIAKVTFDAPAEEKKPARGGKDEGDVDPIKVGAEVEVTTKRGKKLVGEITELTDDELVLKTDDGVEDLMRDRIDTIKLLKAAKGAKADDKPAGKGKTAEKPEAEDDKKGSRTRNVGVSVGTRIVELMADNMDASEEEIGKLLTKEKIEFKENTLSLNFAATKKTFDILRARKMLKA